MKNSQFDRTLRYKLKQINVFLFFAEQNSKFDLEIANNSYNTIIAASLFLTCHSSVECCNWVRWLDVCGWLCGRVVLSLLNVMLQREYRSPPIPSGSLVLLPPPSKTHME